MRTCLNYLGYIWRHKRFVYLEGRKRGVGVRQLLAHDLSKLRGDEFFPYAEWFYGYQGGSWYDAPKTVHLQTADVYVLPGTAPNVERKVKKAAFDRAWLKHLQRNPHHWQHYILVLDSGETVVLDMPQKYVLEMLADWGGAGLAINGKADVAEWYRKDPKRFQLSPYTRMCLERLLR